LELGVGDQQNLTWGTASLSVCALAASVVTVLFARATLERALLRKGAADLLALNARENMVVMGRSVVGGEERWWEISQLSY
jgi:hypothetical protein